MKTTDLPRSVTPFRRSVWHRRTGATLPDLCVVLVAMLILLVAVPTLRRAASEQNNRIKCAANLRSIAMHGFMYANNDTRAGQKFPRTYYNPSAALDQSLTGGKSAAPSRMSYRVDNLAVVGVNNTMASFYQLLKATDLTTEMFVCPSTEAQRAYVGEDIQNYSNWPAPYAGSNSYSYNCPFPTKNAVSSGWKFDTTLGPDYPFAADMNPGVVNGAGPTTVAYTDGREAMQAGNSPNHWYEGQQVAYCDGHVEWQTSPFAGVQRATAAFRDNIFVSYAGTSPAGGKGGTIWAQPSDAADFVLLPTAQDSPGATIAARLPGMSPPMEPAVKWLIGGGIATLVILTIVVIVIAKKKPKYGQMQPYPAGMMPPGAYPPGAYPPGYPSPGAFPQQQQEGYPPIAGAPPAGYQSPPAAPQQPGEGHAPTQGSEPTWTDPSRQER